ncbi:MAG: ATP-binding protein [Firmicutes bacterium]|nr:ATP-binding protein [Bacillota bacterium]
MEHKIKKHMLLIGAVSIFFTAALLIAIFFNIYRTQVKNDLQAAGQLASAGEAISGEEYFPLLKSRYPELRITLIDNTGSVIYDSEGSAGSMEDHSSRPEIAAARQDGEGFALRHSSTLDETMYYYALRLSDGRILRVARAAHSFRWVVQSAVPLLLIVCIFMFVLCMVLSSVLTKRILAPVNAMQSHLYDADPDDIYEELSPFLAAIRRQQSSLQAQKERLEREKDRITLISENMSEGLILLDTDRNILLINRSAAALLNAKPGDYTGRNLLTLTRSLELLQAVEDTAENRSGSIVLNPGGRYVQVFVSPAMHKEHVIGSICFVLDITEKTLAEKSRQDFTANISHELKTPMTSISGYAELIENGLAKEEDIPLFAARIRKEAGRLIALINDIIELSQLDEGVSKKEFEPVALQETVQKILAALEIPAKKAGVTLSFSGEEATVFANRSMMDELVMNLCDNAVRYNKPGGSVTVSTAPVNGDVVLTVRDTGIGIPEASQSRVFERFYRVDKSRSKASGGTGLGLAIVKHIVELHSGKITLRSTPGEGTEITVTLPSYVRRAAAAIAENAE